MEHNQNIAKIRAELATRSFDHGAHWRILFLGKSVNGSTDIVSCLSRSLRNLGHHVLDIDLKRHRGLIDNPTRAQGGNGPIYVRTDGLEQVLRRFEPQMIVCCAGGLTFRPDDAEALKRRGIVLVGLTLSDPDVFASVHPHAQVFDFHTTNARVAMPMYRDAGVHNTLYFPFGIDRGFVAQAVPRAPELAADVICIGHATARPERNAIMARVARDLDVRTYGRGWELPGSEVVEGRRMVQASREGRVHVNFPLTRAGYINIKCGVFESVGSGALVATGRFEEMEDFFTYDEEIIGYRDEEDLVGQVRSILADPALYRAMTERAFDRLANGHLYEHRWIALFEQIQSIVAAGGSWLGQAREADVATILATSLPRAKHILLSGFYGASNVGDELILRSISERIQAADDAAQIWVGAENPDQVERSHGLQAFPRKSLPHALNAARTASGVVLGGGGLWHDYTFERSGGLLGLFHAPQISIAGFGALPLMGRMFDAPFHVVGMGIGPLEDADAKRMMGFIGGHAESVMVRDAESYAYAVESLPFPDRVRQAPDVVYGLQLPPLPAPAEVVAFRESGFRIVGLNLRPWAHTDEDLLVEQVAEGLIGWSRREPIAMIGIPMQAGERVDLSVIGRVARRIAEQVPSLVLRAPLGTDELLATLASLDALVSMRLHACLLAHRLGRPVVGIAYDPKVANHFAELGRAHVCLRLPLEAERLETAIAVVAAERDGLPAEARERIRGLEVDAAEALNAVATRLAATRTRPVVFEVPRLESPSIATAPSKPSSAGQPPAIATAPAWQAESIVGVRCTVLAHATSGSIVMPERSPRSASNGIAVWLPTEAPTRGDGMEASGVIEVQGQGDVELAMSLIAPYENQKALGRIRYTLEIDERWRISEDLAAVAAPLQLRLFAVAPARIPFRLSVYVERTTFASSAWPRASRVAFQVKSAEVSAHGCDSRLVTSRGEPVALTQPIAAALA